MGTIYRKTAKGSSEIETREHRLPPRMRSTLILVDGRRSDDDLRAMIAQQCDETLLALLESGFIEAIGRTDRARTAAAPASTPANPAPPAPSRAAPTDLARLQRESVRALTDLVGPMAESLALRMERARTLAELAPLIDAAAKTIANVRGAQAGESYRARFTPAA